MANDSLSICVTNELSEIPLAAARVAQFCRENGISQKVIQRFTLALDEVLTNIVSHGLLEGRHEIAVSVEFRDETLIGNVSDGGAPFDPLTQPAPDIHAPVEDRQVGGLGIHLLRTLMDAVEYHRADGRNHLKFRIRAV